MSSNNQMQPPPIDEVEFIDAENYHPPEQGALSYEQLVLEQIRRCILEGSKEMIGGYMQQKVSQRGVIEVYIPDQREVYIQCVTSLYDLLLAYFDDEIWKAIDNFSFEMELSKDNKIESLKKKILYVNDIRVKQQIQQQIDTKFLDRDSIEARQLSEEKVDLYHELFQELLLLYSRKKYLMSESITA